MGLAEARGENSSIKAVERFWSWPTLTLFFTYPNPKTIRALLKKVLQLCTTFHCSTYTNFLVSNSTKSSFVLFRLPRRKVIHFHALKQIMKNVWKVGRRKPEILLFFQKGLWHHTVWKSFQKVLLYNNATKIQMRYFLVDFKCCVKVYGKWLLFSSEAPQLSLSTMSFFSSFFSVWFYSFNEPSSWSPGFSHSRDLLAAEACRPRAREEGDRLQ